MDVVQKTYISRMTKWANEMERALHALTGEGGFYPPFSFSALIRGYKTKPVIVPDKKDVAPELLSDIQAVIDDCNTAITETFTDAPAKFSANDMPSIILAHVNGISAHFVLLHEVKMEIAGGEDVYTQIVNHFGSESAAGVSSFSFVVSPVFPFDNTNTGYRSNIIPFAQAENYIFSGTVAVSLLIYKYVV